MTELADLARRMNFKPISTPLNDVFSSCC